jgi:hypothetical protein
MSNQIWDEKTQTFFYALQKAQNDQDRHKIQTEWRNRVAVAIKQAINKPQNVSE